MSLTHVLTQTHRHYAANCNVIGTDDARKNKHPLVADCGTVWIPGAARDTKSLPMCPECEVAYARRLMRPSDLRPHFVYRCFDGDDRLIYVGCSASPRQRMDQHRGSSWWFNQVERTRYVVFNDKDYALGKEREAIATENPRWNLKGRDRALWTAADYEDIHFAMIQNGASDKRLQKHADEARRRYSLDLLGEVS
ncbi:DUF3039 domain-containing protein [Nocardioides sp. WS12]|uniref:DUF3039 domain-containing protein n=1 Tax=Nocardioides sp. WS12 TaxID=2486272 RepID=UPI00191E979E|nr:DUF3039 domain-containing protein [Nocardioides sp. WS12]